MFEREHHRHVATVLESLDAGVLLANGCLFGGGTAIVLRHGEYRESVAVDFLISSQDGYRELRQILTGRIGLNGLARVGAKLEESRELRADQYGVRTRVRVLDTDIKFEIVFEARVELDPPGPDDRVCGVATLLLPSWSKVVRNTEPVADDGIARMDGVRWIG